MRRMRLLQVMMLAAVVGCQTAGMASAGSNESVLIVYPSDASQTERLAAKEIRRYLYLRTGKLLPLHQADGEPSFTDALIGVGQKNRSIVNHLMNKDNALRSSVSSLQPQQYHIKTLENGKQRAILIAGGDGLGTLYGAYRFIEHYDVRFYLHGDVVPDQKIALGLPSLDEQGKPLFGLRGIHPFHDFPEGPDWWSVDDYRAIIGQLPKLRMNFFGLHCYPEGGVGPEPTVWIGLADDIDDEGKVTFSSRSSYANSLRGNWGYSAKKTGEYTFGAAQLFERDDYGAEVMFGMIPWSETLEQRNEMFNRAGNMLREAFEYAQALGVKTCVGTETPLIIPNVVKQHIKAKGKDPSALAVVQQVYEGMFERIKRAYPLDYYWLWTPEGWTWGDPKEEQVEATQNDLLLAVAAARKIGAPFTLATCGWVLGPPRDRAQFDHVLPKETPFSCINRQVGFAPVEPSFARLKGRPKWAIPWLEDDPALIIPQLWAGRMRRDAADALAYGCTGLMGIHWRTRILGPNISALARAGWEQSAWNPDFGKKAEPPEPKLTEGREGGNIATFPNSPMADTEDDPLYQTVRWDVKVYRLKVPNGKYKVTLQFCEPHYDAAGKRVFGVELQGKRVIGELDIFAKVGKNRAMDYTFDDVAVANGFLEINFIQVVEYPCIAAFVVEGQGGTRKINCGGPAYQDYEADLQLSGPDGRPRDLPVDDFYADWALTQFGPQAATPIAQLFTRLDGSPPTNGAKGTANLPRPSTWVQGPGGIQPDPRPWQQVSKEYAFVDELAKLRPQVKGAGNLERFDYWLNTFRYLRAVGRVNCTWASFNAAMKAVKEAEPADTRRRLAHQTALPLRKELVAQVSDVHRHLLATVSTPGAMGNVANWQQHLMPSLLTEPGQELANIMGEDLPADAQPRQEYRGPTRVIVPTVRNSLLAGEDLRLKVIVLAQNQPNKAFLYWRPMGTDKYDRIPLGHVAGFPQGGAPRGVYSVTIPAGQIKEADLEYHIKVTAEDGRDITFPATAPGMNQTVVIMQ